MFKLFLLPAFIHLVLLTKVSSGYSNDDIENKITWANNALTGTLLYNHLVNNFGVTHSVASSPILALLAQTALHSEENKFRELAPWLNFNSKDEIRRAYSIMLRRINSDTRVNETFAAFVGRKDRVSSEFMYNFKEVCNGDVQYLNYVDVGNATNNINYWFKKQYNGLVSDVINPQYLLDHSRGLIFGTYMETMMAWDHPFNPKGLIGIDFHTINHEVQRQVALYGNGFVRYGEFPEYRLKAVLLSTKGVQNSVLWLFPNKPEDLVNIFYHIKNPDVLYGILSRLRETCLKLYITVGQSHSINRYSTSIPALNLDLFGLKKVYENDYGSTDGFSILQQLHLIADKDVRDGPIDSPVCPGDNYPLLKIDHYFAYMVFDEYKLPLYAGLFNGV